MKVCYETSIQDFEFWGGAEDHANMLTESELDQFEDFVNEAYPEGIENTQLNDWMWFDFESVCTILGLVFDTDKGEVIR
jgi:hypothetical protein